jgi:hypothetical protein
MNTLPHHDATVLVRLTAPEKRELVRIAKAGDMRPAEIAPGYAWEKMENAMCDFR